MSDLVHDPPPGEQTAGLVIKLSPWSVAETVQRLSDNRIVRRFHDALEESRRRCQIGHRQGDLLVRPLGPASDVRPISPSDVQLSERFRSRRLTVELE